MRLGYIGIDQYGQHYHLTEHPRKELLEQLGASRAANMYADTTGGKVKHKGYVISGHWIDVYAIHEWKPAQ